MRVLCNIVKEIFIILLPFFITPASGWAYIICVGQYLYYDLVVRVCFWFMGSCVIARLHAVSTLHITFVKNSALANVFVSSAWEIFDGGRCFFACTLPF